MNLKYKYKFKFQEYFEKMYSCSEAYRKIKCDLLIFSGVKKWLPSRFLIFDGFYSFFS